MIIVSILSLLWISNETNVALLPGYYSLKLIGATGGSTKINNKECGGGPGAQFTGVLNVTEDVDIRIVAGSNPGIWTGRGKHPSGQYGEGGSGGGINVAAGGGYSALFKNTDPIVMVGGGGGALRDKWGSPAGGFKSGQSYLLNDTHEEFKKGIPNNHRGGDGNEENPQGSGGGGGYFGGNAVMGSKGLGGSSYVNEEYFTTYKLIDGLIAWNIPGRPYFGDGLVEITNITICNRNCLSCDVQNSTVCYTCRPGKPYYNKRCINSCDELDFPTYEDSDHTCKQCMNNCEQCQNATFCLVCKNGFHFDGQKCTNEAKIQHPPTSNQKENSKKAVKIIPTGTEPKSSKQLPWWIIGVICGAVLIIVILIVVIYKKKKDTSSVEMTEEKVDKTKEITVTSVTVDNPLYLDSANQEADPFHNDFEEDYEVSQVFKSHYPDDEVDDEK